MPKKRQRWPKTMAEALDRLTGDTQRLQFLQDHSGEVICHEGQWAVCLKEPFVYVDRQSSLREAVDLAMKERAERLRLKRFPLSA